jgi:hypothetical protein
MILPIIGYGDPVLKVAENVSAEFPDLKEKRLTWKPCIMLGMTRTEVEICIFCRYFSDDRPLDKKTKWLQTTFINAKKNDKRRRRRMVPLTKVA